jgi:hypothetical protein
MQAVAPGADESWYLVAGGPVMAAAACIQAALPAAFLMASWQRSESCSKWCGSQSSPRTSVETPAAAGGTSSTAAGARAMVQAGRVPLRAVGKKQAGGAG